MITPIECYREKNWQHPNSVNFNFRFNKDDFYEAVREIPLGAEDEGDVEEILLRLYLITKYIKEKQIRDVVVKEIQVPVLPDSSSIYIS